MLRREGTLKGVGGTALYHQAWLPEGEPKAVVALVHGFGEHSGRYHHVGEWLAARGYALHGLDLRGHGRSAGQRGYIAHWGEFREDLRAFLALLSAAWPGKPLFLLGHSMGGLIALDYALRHPEGLAGVIASAPVLSQPKVPPILYTLSRILSRIWPRLALNSQLDPATLSRDPAVVQAYRNDPLVHSWGTPRLGTELTATVHWVMAHAAELRIPLLMLQGSADHLVPPEGNRAFFAAVTLADKERIEYPGYYHEPHNDLGWERPLADLVAWLERHLPQAPRP